VRERGEGYKAEAWKMPRPPAQLHTHTRPRTQKLLMLMLSASDALCARVLVTAGEDGCKHQVALSNKESTKLVGMQLSPRADALAVASHDSTVRILTHK
jgi:hypothetical protein